jgi:hypothetical protein
VECHGNLKVWDVTARLGQLDLPVLVSSGRHDEMTPALVRPQVDGIRGAEWVLFEDSAHLAMAEEPDRYRRCSVLAQSGRTGRSRPGLIEAGPAGGLRAPSGPATPRQSPRWTRAAALREARACFLDRLGVGRVWRAAR